MAKGIFCDKRKFDDSWGFSLWFNLSIKLFNLFSSLKFKSFIFIPFFMLILFSLFNLNFSDSTKSLNTISSSKNKSFIILKI